MPRIIFKKSTQADFLHQVKAKNSLTIDQLASISGISPRTFRDWFRGKFTMSHSALINITKKYDLPLPSDIEIVGDFWYGLKGARKGALRRLELYGPPGTPKGRRKGGVISQLRRKEDPEKYKLLGCNIRKEFAIQTPSVEFAETTGIILGDGAITKDQVRISVSRLVDKDYSKFIQTLFNQVFGEKPSVIEYKSPNVITLTISGAGLVEELRRWGLKQGDKIRQQVDFPDWIWKDMEFTKACIRGLFDTDGSCYSHLHTTNGLAYKNFGWCFSNHSLPLINSFAKVLNMLNFKFSITHHGTKIYIYNFKEIRRYFELIGSSNPKHLNKFLDYSNLKSRRVMV